MPAIRTPFFTASEISSKRPIGLIPQCGACGLDKQCLSPKMQVSGQGKQEILIIGEAPGKIEDEQNRPFIGKAGQYLQECLSRFGIDLRTDCWIINSLSCRPPANRKPTEKEIGFCRPKVVQHIKDLKPKVILLFGGAAVSSVLGWLWKDHVGEISRWVGWHIPSQQLNSWITPNFHPSFIKRSEKRGKLDPVLELYFNQYLQKGLENKDRPWDTIPEYRKECKVIRHPTQAAHMVREVGNMGLPIAFDFETEGLKPEKKNGYELQIVCCGVSNGAVTFAYPWHGEAIAATKELLEGPLPKIGANEKFEIRWCKQVGIEVRNWAWDVCTTAHILDNRPEISSVKFQSFVLLGLPSYNDSIKPYLESQPKSGYGKNEIREANLDKVLEYCAMDSLVELEIAKIQSKNLGVEIGKELRTRQEDESSARGDCRETNPFAKASKPVD